jgi:hypothetical protein
MSHSRRRTRVLDDEVLVNLDLRCAVDPGIERWLGGRDSLPLLSETPIRTPNYRATLSSATIWRFLILAMARVRSLWFSDSSGAMTLEMSLAASVSRGSVVGLSPRKLCHRFAKQFVKSVHCCTSAPFIGSHDLGSPATARRNRLLVTVLEPATDRRLMKHVLRAKPASGHRSPLGMTTNDVSAGAGMSIYSTPTVLRVTQIRLVFNWFEELKRLVPTR